MRQSIRQSHIYINQELQRLGAHKRDKQFDSSVDFALNAAMTKFIRSKVKPSPNNSLQFEIDEINRNDIDSIVVEDYPLRVFRVSDVKSLAILPPQIKYLLNSRSLVVEDCQEEFEEPTIDAVEYVRALPFIDGEPNTNGLHYTTIKVTKDSNNQTLSSTGYALAEEKVFLIEHVLELFKTLGVTAYWEKYKTTFKKDSFLIISNDAADNTSLTVDGKLAVAVVTSSNSTYYKDLSDVGTVVDNRHVKHSVIGSVLDSNYHVPNPKSPVITISNGQLHIHHTKRFLVGTLLLDWIRIPKPVSLLLDQGIELNEDSHDRVCDIAVEKLKEILEIPSLQTKVQLGQLRN